MRVEVVQLATELTSGAQMLTLDTEDARRWEPERLRLRLFSIAGRIARHAHHIRLRLSGNTPHASLLAEPISGPWTPTPPGRVEQHVTSETQIDDRNNQSRNCSGQHIRNVQDRG